jgi:hypothetical protein
MINVGDDNKQRFSLVFEFARLPLGYPASKIKLLVVRRHVNQYPETRQPPYDLLTSYADSQCSNPRDKGFALLGLVAPGERTLLQRCFPTINQV